MGECPPSPLGPRFDSSALPQQGACHDAKLRVTMVKTTEGASHQGTRGSPEAGGELPPMRMGGGDPPAHFVPIFRIFE